MSKTTEISRWLFCLFLVYLYWYVVLSVENANLTVDVEDGRPADILD